MLLFVAFPGMLIVAAFLDEDDEEPLLRVFIPSGRFDSWMAFLLFCLETEKTGWLVDAWSLVCARGFESPRERLEWLQAVISVLEDETWGERRISELSPVEREVLFDRAERVLQLAVRCGD